MSDFTLMSVGQSRELEEAQKRLLSPALEEALWSLDKEALAARGWKSIPIPGNFLVETDPDSDPNWPLKDGAPKIFSHFEPLFWHLQRLGRTEIILSVCPYPCEGLIPAKFAEYCLCPLDARTFIEAGAALNRAAPNPRFMKLGEMLVFDVHEDWVITGNRDAGCLLSGVPAIIDGYYEAAGGEDIVRAYFYHFEMHEGTDWSEETGKPLPFIAKLYDFVGWPYPIYPEKHNDLWRKGLDWSAMFGDRIRSDELPSEDA